MSLTYLPIYECSTDIAWIPALVAVQSRVCKIFDMSLWSSRMIQFATLRLIVGHVIGKVWIWS